MIWKRARIFVFRAAGTRRWEANLTVHVVQVNHTCDPDLRDPDELLERYATLTGWSDALVAAGATRVTVVQEFHRDAERVRRNVRYVFRASGRAPLRSRASKTRRLHQTVADLGADVVHINGLCFPAETRWLRQRLPADAAVVVQDHASRLPANPVTRLQWRRGLRASDGFLFSAQGLAEPWRAAGLIGRDQPVRDVMPSSTHFRPMDRAAARAQTGLPGDPALLWVGRLNANKDPLTVLEGFARALHGIPGAHLTLLYGTVDLLPEVRAFVARTPGLTGRVHFRGNVPHNAIAAFYSAADLFVVGSHFEGSGYALIEAIACGLLPVVTDIPSFRALTADGTLGILWPPGDAGALAAALTRAARRDRAAARSALTTHFTAELSWPAIGRRALEAYTTILEAARRRA